jgi:simple sugar transport system ATP-binding protein
MSKILSVRNVSKSFGTVQANSDISFDLEEGEILVLLGENGAGKTTLLNIIYGYYKPDKGKIFVKGRELTLNSTKDAIKNGISKVHQLIELVPTLTAFENIVIGMEPLLSLNPLNKYKEKIIAIAKELGYNFPLNARVEDLPVGDRQKAQIVKALLTEPRILLLDEPTTQLTPLEVKELFDLVKKLSKKGYSIIFTTHRLEEVEIADRIIVLRNGKVVLEKSRGEYTEEELVKAIIGEEGCLKDRDLTQIKYQVKKPLLELKNVSLFQNDRILLEKITFTLHSGEILGIAGVSGNGQRELIEVILGLRKPYEGQIVYLGKDVTNDGLIRIPNIVAWIPEERRERGIIEGLSIEDNLILGRWSELTLPKIKWVIDNFRVKEFTKKLISEYNIKTTNPKNPVESLSGGNIQRLILARELTKDISILIAEHPIAGLDIKSEIFVKEVIANIVKRGCGVIWVDSDLDALCEMCDQIIVMYRGKALNAGSPAKRRKEEIGRLMTEGRND